MSETINLATGSFFRLNIKAEFLVPAASSFSKLGDPASITLFISNNFDISRVIIHANGVRWLPQRAQLRQESSV